MESFIHIRLYVDGKTYPARLYGDKIISEEANLTVNKSQISQIRVNYFKKNIRIVSNSGTIVADYSSHIVRWLDPMRSVRHVVIGTFVLIPPVLSVILFGISSFLTSLFISLFIGLPASYFFHILRQNQEYVYIKLFSLILMICLPVMYWYPFSVYIFMGAAGLFLLFSFLHYMFPHGFKVYNYYISLSWMLIMFFCYFWILGSMKIWSDYQVYGQAKSNIEISEKEGAVVFGNILWQKPLDWKISEFHFPDTILKRRELLWQISPFPIQFRISNLENPGFGWIVAVNDNPQTVLSQINSYLEEQKNIIMAEFQERDNPVVILSQAGSGMLQSFVYYDMVLREDREFHILIIPVDSRDKQGSLVFAFNLSPNASLNYYLDLFKNSIKKLP